jgi:CMP/dCMP kinase
MLHWAIVNRGKRLIVAVDGPSGAGKGTVAKATALALDYTHVDTGAMYRAVAWRALDLDIPLEAADQVAGVARAAQFTLDGGRTVIDGCDVTEAIRTPAMDMAAATVARNPAVRAALVERQRAIGGGGGVVMEGRDIGTVVFPAADVKVYLDASPEERARRRAADPAHSGGGTGVATVAEGMAARDKSDSSRSISPLIKAADAVYIDTTGIPIERVVEQVVALVRDKAGTRDQGPGNRGDRAGKE